MNVHHDSLSSPFSDALPGQAGQLTPFRTDRTCTLSTNDIGIDRYEMLVLSGELDNSTMMLLLRLLLCSR